MSTNTHNLTQTPQNRQLNTKPLNTRAADLRSCINRLRQQHGDILNTWPAYALADFQRLRRELNEIEASYAR